MIMQYFSQSSKSLSLLLLPLYTDIILPMEGRAKRSFLHMFFFQGASSSMQNNIAIFKFSRFCRTFLTNIKGNIKVCYSTYYVHQKKRYCYQLIWIRSVNSVTVNLVFQMTLNFFNKHRDYYLDDR